MTNIIALVCRSSITFSISTQLILWTINPNVYTESNTPNEWTKQVQNVHKSIESHSLVGSVEATTRRCGPFECMCIGSVRTKYEWAFAHSLHSFTHSLARAYLPQLEAFRDLFWHYSQSRVYTIFLHSLPHVASNLFRGSAMRCTIYQIHIAIPLKTPKECVNFDADAIIWMHHQFCVVSMSIAREKRGFTMKAIGKQKQKKYWNQINCQARTKHIANLKAVNWIMKITH